MTPAHATLQRYVQLEDCRLRLMHDWVFVQVHKLPERYKGTILLPQGETGSNLRAGTVVAYGPGEELSNGVREPIGVKVHDVVVFHRWNMEHKQGRAIGHLVGDGAALIKARDILLVLPEGTKGVDLS